MSDESIEQKTKKQVEHIALSEVASKKITSWIEQAAAKKKGVRITRKDFLNWLIEKCPENLSSGDLSALIEKFYDEESFLRQLLREVKKAKLEGLTEPSHELIVRARKTELKKEVPTEDNEKPD